MDEIVFGPTFGDEVLAAGLGGLPFAWTPYGEINGRENLTIEQNATLDGVVAAHDPTATAVPHDISERQFHQALATYVPGTGRVKAGAGLVTEQEAIDAVSIGAQPPPIAAFIASLPPEDQFAANMFFAGEGTASRYAPLMEQFRVFQGWTPRQMDDLFRYAATL